jgi:hypothetical protein
MDVQSERNHSQLSRLSGLCRSSKTTPKSDGPGSVSAGASVPRVEEPWNGEERRKADRRNQPTRPWSGFLTPLRRAHGRRSEDQASYVDRYTKQDVILLLTIFLLNVGDAFFTLLWLSRGGREANPVMDFFLDIGPWAFLGQKCLVVGLWLVILVVHKNFRMARIGLYSALFVYGMLMILHFGIIALGIEPIPTTHRSEYEIHIAPGPTVPALRVPFTGTLLEPPRTRGWAVDPRFLAGSSDGLNRRVDRSATE